MNRFVTAEWAKLPDSDPFIGSGKGVIGVRLLFMGLLSNHCYKTGLDSINQELEDPQGQHTDDDGIGHIFSAPGDQDRQYT